MNILRLAPLAAVALVACQPAPPETPPLAGAKIGGPFTLTDQDGRTVSDRAFAGRYRIMYFGYTFCPDVCPTDAATIGAALSDLDRSDPDLAKRIVPIFVTVDPARDTPKVLKAFTAAFHPRMIGLTGTPAQIAAVSKAFGVYAGKGATQPGGGYLVNHSRTTYLMDPDDKPLALLPTEQGPRAVAAEIKRWAK
ncbi:SCO family protein [Sphingomonas kyungheensis]|uniref:SCO family protein n=1 Tax=Sphingomonas kyungheensis TaxID=1069987 RepID=A0ABU8H4Y8_9SPHN